MKKEVRLMLTNDSVRHILGIADGVVRSEDTGMKAQSARRAVMESRYGDLTRTLFVKGGDDRGNTIEV